MEHNYTIQLGPNFTNWLTETPENQIIDKLEIYNKLELMYQSSFDLKSKEDEDLFLEIVEIEAQETVEYINTMKEMLELMRSDSNCTKKIILSLDKQNKKHCNLINSLLYLTTVFVKQ